MKARIRAEDRSSQWASSTMNSSGPGSDATANKTRKVGPRLERAHGTFWHLLCRWPHLLG